MEETFREDLQNWHLIPKRTNEAIESVSKHRPTSQNSLADHSHHKHPLQTDHWRSSGAQEGAYYTKR